MNSSGIKNELGIVGFILLIFSSVFLNIPMVGLLAMPCFAASAICLIIYLLRFKKPTLGSSAFSWFSLFLIVFGVILFSATMGLAGIKFAGYFTVSGSPDIADRFHPKSLKTIYIILISDFVASTFIAWGLRMRSDIKNKSIFLAWILFFLSVPLVVAMLKLLQVIMFHNSK